MVSLTDFTTEATIPGVFKLGATWRPDNTEKEAAWELYVELITRVTVAPMDTHATAREALTSLYSIFGTVRFVLRKYGPAVARPKAQGELSLGLISVRLLNNVLRPMLAQWHPQLALYEESRSKGTGPLEHERQWPQMGELLVAIDHTREILDRVATLLAEVAGVLPIHEVRPLTADD